MPEPLCVIWDHEAGGNVEHLAEQGVAPEEAEDAICVYFDQRKPSRTMPRYWVVRGFTTVGRFLVVVFEYLADDDMVIPVTAYEPEDT